MTASPPRAVLFDLFNTLVRSGDLAERVSTNSAMGEVLGVDPTGYDRAFRAAYRERDVGGLGGLADTVRAVAARVGGSPTDAQVARAAGLRLAMTGALLAQVSDGSLAALDKLRAGGWKLGLVSNATADTSDRFRESPLAARFDATAFSNEYRVAKPDPAIYLAACRALGVAPASCVYIGDGADDELAGASALGMRAIRTTEHADSDPTWTGPTIATLPEVLAVVS